MLARHSQLAQQEDHTALQCLCRGWLLLASSSSQLQKDAAWVLQSIAPWLDAPLLLWRLLPFAPFLDRSLQYAGMLREIDRSLGPISLLLDWLDSNDCQVSTTEKLLLCGRIEMCFVDPPAAIQTLDELDSLDPSNLTGQLYLAWAMIECLEDPSAHIAHAVQLAAAALQNPACSRRAAFDAGHLLLLADDLPAAAEAFERSVRPSGAHAGDQPLFLPGLAMAWWCRHELHQRDIAWRHLEVWLDEEQRRAQAHTHDGLLTAAAMPCLDPRTAEGINALEHVFERFECRIAIEALPYEENLHRFASFRWLMNHLNRDIENWVTDIAKRYAQWGEELEEHTQWFKQWRRQRTEAWLAVERARLTAALDWLQVGDLRGRALIDHIASRIYHWTPAPECDSLLDALRLLCVEHRLPAEPMLLLMLYAHSRDCSTTPHATYTRATVKSIITAATGASMIGLGLDPTLSIISAATGIGIMGDVIPEYLDVWLVNRRTVHEPFPRFDCFQAELQERIEQGVAPPLDSFLAQG